MHMFRTDYNTSGQWPEGKLLTQTQLDAYIAIMYAWFLCLRVLGLPLGLEAPVMTPNGVTYLFFLLAG